jgi:hypothetical protein
MYCGEAAVSVIVYVYGGGNDRWSKIKKLR